MSQCKRIAIDGSEAAFTKPGGHRSTLCSFQPGPGLSAHGAVYSFTADSDMVAGDTFNNDETTVVGEVVRNYETQRSPFGLVTCLWWPVGKNSACAGRTR